MTNGMNIVTYGGIAFNRDEVKNVNIKRDFCMSGDLYTVETSFGTFSYRDFPNSIKSGDKEIKRSIYGNTITDCTLESIKGTDSRDFYKLRSSYVNKVDLSGDQGNTDSVTLSKNSRVGEYKLDKDDIYFEPTDWY